MSLQTSAHYAGHVSTSEAYTYLQNSLVEDLVKRPKHIVNPCRPVIHEHLVVTRILSECMGMRTTVFQAKQDREDNLTGTGPEYRPVFWRRFSWIGHGRGMTHFGFGAAEANERLNIEPFKYPVLR